MSPRRNGDLWDPPPLTRISTQAGISLVRMGTRGSGRRWWCGWTRKGFGRVVSLGSAEDQGHQVSFRRRRHDLSDNDGLFRCSAFYDVLGFGVGKDTLRCSSCGLCFIFLF